MLKFIFASLLLMLALLPLVAFGQPDIPASPSQAPIDGGLGILAAAGGAYALKKISDKRS